MKITIEGGSLKELAENLSDELLRLEFDDEEGHRQTLKKHAHRLAHDMIKRTVETEVREALSTYSQAKVRELVDGILAEGIRKTNTWGDPTGEVQSWKSYVIGLLHDRNGNFNIQRVAAEAAHKLIASETGAIAEVQKAFREHVDELLQTHLKAKIREAAGLAR